MNTVCQCHNPLFQIQSETIFLTDDHNTAVFPQADGKFLPEVLILGSHYEVNGTSISNVVAGPSTIQPPPMTAQHTTSHGSFAFAARAVPAAQPHQLQQVQQPQFRRPPNRSFQRYKKYQTAILLKISNYNDKLYIY